MAQTQTRPHQPQELDASKLLDQVLANTPAGQKAKLLHDKLIDRLATIREALPASLKAEAERFVRRAAIYFADPDPMREKLRQCDIGSVMMCVLRAAELGLAIDGRLAYAVPYKGKAQLQLDYKGMLAVARRAGTIKDAFARLVFANDAFRFFHADGRDQIDHEINLENPGKLRGAYACVVLPNGFTRYDWMNVADLDAIRRRSIAFVNGAGPWISDEGEMRKKTVLKRALKTYTEDPTIGAMLAVDDADFDLSPAPAATPGRRAASMIHGSPPAAGEIVDETPALDEEPEPREIEQTQTASPPVDEKAALEAEAAASEFEQEIREATGNAEILASISSRLGEEKVRLGKHYKRLIDLHARATKQKGGA